MKVTTSWFSDRLATDVNVVRWGETGTPFLLFPTAGGDAEEIERFLIIDTLSSFLEQGRIKIYSCDSVAGRVMLAEQGSPAYRMRMLDRFHHFVYHEMVPAIRTDCRSDDIGIVVAGASIGAYNALAMVCRFPDAFTHAICMSGTYQLERFLKAPVTQDFYYASPAHFLPGLDGSVLDQLRTRFILLPSGEGRAENIGESWKIADLLGSKGVPNRVDSWGPDWHHDWPTWRNMLVKYVDELIPPV